MNAKTTRSSGGSIRALLADSAWMLLLRGAIGILFGVLAIAWPGLTLLVLVMLFAVYALLGGVVSIAGAFRIRRVESKWWLPLLLGIVSIVAGIYALVAPALTTLVLVLVMGVNAIITGALDIALAVRLRKVLRSQWLLVVGGVVSILFGVLVLARPDAGAVALVWMVSLYALLTGVLLFALGLRVRREARNDSFRDPVNVPQH
ncbi:MAG: putative rane protein [Conexibacter sp.]|nr:putative rane protein [Conexibacter sp.]